MIRIRIGSLLMVGVSLLSFCLAMLSVTNAQEPLTLKQSIEIALEGHSAIRQAKASVWAAKSQSKSSATAFLPSASVSGRYVRLDQNQYRHITIKIGGKEEMMDVPVLQKFQYSADLQVVQPLFAGGAIYYSHKQAKTGVGIAKEQLEGTKQDVALGVARAYYSVLQAQRLLGVAKLTQQAMEAHRKTAKHFYEAGAVAKVDLLQAEVRLAEAQQGVIKASNAVETAKAAFNNSLGRDISAPVELLESHLAMPSELTLSDCLETALSERPELLAMRKTIDASKASEKLACSTFFPQISGVYDKTLDKDTLTWDRDEAWRVSIVASWNLWQWGKRKFDLDYARAKTAEARHQASVLEDSILLEVKQAFLSVDQAKKLIAVTKRAIEQAEENVRMNDERYAQNMVTMTDVLDAEVLLANARMNYYVALYGYDVAVARLLRAMGERIDAQALPATAGGR
ncbi:MAG: hypothetical protein DRH70_07835 [Candidatus Coatesbacteria bacterium]|nr:MAG: hypothetical protein DRH70_07835 [Candidatus Coatesbacteria bacterium]